MLHLTVICKQFLNVAHSLVQPLTSVKLMSAVLGTVCLQVIASSLPGCDADPALISFSCSK